MARLTKDTVAKRLMGRADIFASVFNYYLYGGRNVIKPEDLKEVPTEQLYYRGFDEARRHRDILKIAELREGPHGRFLFLGVEN